MTSLSNDVLVCEGPALARWTEEQERALLADTFAARRTPIVTPCPEMGGWNGGHDTVRTQRSNPDPEPERPATSRITGSEWHLAHTGALSGRTTFRNAFDRTGGERVVNQQDTQPLPASVIVDDRVARGAIRANADWTVIRPTARRPSVHRMQRRDDDFWRNLR